MKDKISCIRLSFLKCTLKIYITANYAFKTINFESRNINCIFYYIYLKMTYLDTIKYRVHYFCIILNIMRHGTETSADTCAKLTEKYMKNLSLCWQLLVDCSNFCKVGYYLPWHIFLNIWIYRLTYIPGKKTYKVWKKEEGEYWGAIANFWWLSGKKISTRQCRRCRRHWFDPWKIPWRRKCQAIPAFLPG